jgi:hypothetical protein
MRVLLGSLVVCVITAAAPGIANANANANADAGTDANASANEARSLFADVMHDVDALDTGDCVLACKALASIRRAADRLCAIEPGPRCSVAQAKAEDATNRVRAACPACAQIGVLNPSIQPAVEPKAAAPDHQAESADKKSGGCAGCSTTASEGANGDALVLLIGLAWLARGRGRGHVQRRRARRPHPKP